MTTNRVAVVTGGNRGIGRAIALKLASLGFHVVATYRERPSTHDFPPQDNDNQGRIELLQVDVTSPSAIGELFLRIAREHRRLDLLVNNAGIAGEQPLSLTSLQTYRDIFDVNFFGVVNCTKAALALLLRSKGRIINIGSVTADNPPIGLAAYAASKAAVGAFSSALAKELSRYPVPVMVVAPGLVATEMTATRRANSDRSGVPTAPKACAPEEVAELVAFLGTEAPSSMTGGTFHINGLGAH